MRMNNGIIHQLQFVCALISAGCKRYKYLHIRLCSKELHVVFLDQLTFGIAANITYRLMHA